MTDRCELIADPIAHLAVLFSGAPPFSCADAADINDDGQFDIADPVYELSYLFTGGFPPPDPFVACGTDPTADTLDCQNQLSCP